MLLINPRSASKRPERSFFLKAVFCLLLLTAGFGAWSMGRLKAEEAQKNFTYIRPEDMNQIANLHQRAARMIERKDFQAAIDVYSEILLIEPDDDEAYANMGQAYMVLGYLDHAEDAFKNALHINSENEVAALCLRRIKDPDMSRGVEIERPLMPEAVIPETPPVKRQVSLPPAATKENLSKKTVPVVAPPVSKPAAALSVPAPAKPAPPAPLIKAPQTPPAKAVNFSKNAVKKEVIKTAPTPKAITPPPANTAKIVLTPKIIADPPKTAPSLPKASTPPLSPKPVKAEPVKPVVLSKEPVKPAAEISIDYILNSDLSFNQWTQLALKNAGLYKGPIDGKIEGETVTAIQTFQQRNNLEVSGLVGPSTWSKLKQHLDKNHIPKI